MDTQRSQGHPLYRIGARSSVRRLALTLPLLFALAGLRCVQDFVQNPEQSECAASACRARVQVTPEGATLATLGGTVVLRAAVRDAQGVVVLGRAVAWRSFNPAVATVDTATGVVTAVGSGQAIVTATSELDGAQLVGAAVVTVAHEAEVPVGALQTTPMTLRAQINGVWGVSADTVYAVGTSGTLLRRDAAGWRSWSAGTATLFGVGGLGPGNVFAVGDGGTVVRVTGEETAVRETTPATATLRAVWAASPEAIYAVGSNGTILRRSTQSGAAGSGGSARAAVWNVDSSGTTQHLRAIWGSAPSDIYAVGDAGTIRHYDGSAWREVQSRTASILTDVGGTGAGEVFVTTADGTVLRWNGDTWRTAYRDSTASFTAVWVVSSSEVYVAGVGGLVLRYDGAQWVRLPGGGGVTMRALWATAASPLHVVGDDGRLLTASRGGPAGLVFSALPIADIQANAGFDVQVAVVDGSGRVDTTATDSITIALSTGPGGATLLGPTAKRAVRGVAAFTNLRFVSAGSGFVLAATAGGLAPAQSPALTVLGGDPVRLAFRTQPDSATAGVSFTSAVIVGGEDSLGGLVPLADGVVVTLSLQSPHVAARLFGDTVVVAAGGVATFRVVSVQYAAAGHRLRASAARLAEDTSIAFVVSPGPMAQLAILGAPATAAVGSRMVLSTSARDAFGNLIGSQYADFQTTSGSILSKPPLPDGRGQQAGLSNYFDAVAAGQAGVSARTVEGWYAKVVVTVVAPDQLAVQSWMQDPGALHASSADLWDLWTAGGLGLGVVVVGTNGTVLSQSTGYPNPWTRCDLSGMGASPAALVAGPSRVQGNSLRLGVLERGSPAATVHQALSSVVVNLNSSLTACASGGAAVPLGSVDTDSALRYVPRGWGIGLGVSFATGFHTLWWCDEETGLCDTDLSSPTDVFVRDVHAFASDNVFAVGDRGWVQHRKGATVTSIPAPTSETLLGVWGTAETDVFVVGTAGVIYHYDGTAWSAMASGTARTLWDVWGQSDSHVYAVGDGGTILRYDGTGWTPMVSGTTADLHAVSGNGLRGIVYVAGSGGTVLLGTPY